LVRSKNNHIESFELSPNEIVNGKYQIISKLGGGWEGEVYRIIERGTRIERAAKFFFPQRNKGHRNSTRYARKLHKLRDCPILIQYHTREEVVFEGPTPVTCLISDYVEGELLSDFLKRQPGKRISVFQGVTLLHALAVGIEAIHKHGEYHGDLHSENVIVRRYGLGFDLKLLDLFHWDDTHKANMQEDLVDMIKLFHQAIGGKKHYKSQPDEVKFLCCGLRRNLIIERFRSVRRLREYLETMQWS